MSIFNKLSLLACSGVLVLALSACPPPQEEPAGEAEVDVEEVETPTATEEVVEETVEEAPAAADDAADSAGDAMDDSGAADEGSDDSSN